MKCINLKSGSLYETSTCSVAPSCLVPPTFTLRQVICVRGVGEILCIEEFVSADVDVEVGTDVEEDWTVVIVGIAVPVSSVVVVLRFLLGIWE